MGSLPDQEIPVFRCLFLLHYSFFVLSPLTSLSLSLSSTEELHMPLPWNHQRCVRENRCVYCGQKRTLSCLMSSKGSSASVQNRALIGQTSGNITGSSSQTLYLCNRVLSRSWAEGLQLEGQLLKNKAL